jgi:hypothetical protein
MSSLTVRNFGGNGSNRLAGGFAQLHMFWAEGFPQDVENSIEKIINEMAEGPN